MSTFLVTGANRGLGLAYVAYLLQKPNTTVVASVRDAHNSSSQALYHIPKAQDSRLFVITIDYAHPDSATRAIEHLQQNLGVTTVDVVIANAALASYIGPLATMPPAEISTHLQVNVVGVLALFQACLPLLRPSSNPKFIAVTSLGASMSIMDSVPSLPMGGYNMTKAAVNFMVRKLHFEEEWLTTFVLSPGMLDTDMGRESFEKMGVLGRWPLMDPNESARMGVERILGARRETMGGSFQSYDGMECKW